MEHRGSEQEKEEKRAASLTHNKSTDGHDSRARVDDGAAPEHAASGSIGVGAAPGQDGDAVDNEIAGTDEPTTDGRQDGEENNASGSGAPARFQRFHGWEGQGMRARPSFPNGKPHARAKAGQSRNQSRMS